MDSTKRPYLAVLAVQSIYAGMFLISKAAFDVGMNPFIFVFYRQASATLLLAPIALLLERKTAPPLSFKIFSKLFLLSLCGITASLNIYGFGLNYTTASLAAAITNGLPVITFLLALLLGRERVKLRKKHGIAKVVGIALCMGGVITIAFYRGPQLKLLFHHHDQNHVPSSSNKSWIKGVFLLLFSNIFWGLWLVLQVPVLKSYPSKLLFTTSQCFLSSIQSFVVAIALERDLKQWKLGWNVRLFSVAYCGIVVTGLTFYLQSWVIEKKGPVFLAMTTPLALVITIASSAFLFGETITLGSVVGGILLIGGLYGVLWGKSKEQIATGDGKILEPIGSSLPIHPLPLQCGTRN